jgi:hypothetical protein
MQATGYSVVELTEKYERGLKDGIVAKVYNNDLPMNLGGWMSTALHFDKLEERLRQRRKGIFNPQTYERTDKKGNAQMTNVTTPKTTTADYKPNTTGPMDIDKARREGRCRHCGSAWEVGHMCKRKRSAQTNYQQRFGGAQRREIQTDETVEAQLARALDAIELMKKELKGKGN